MDNNRYMEISQKINLLIARLSSDASDIGDWKVTKCMEAKLQNDKMPYDIDKLIAGRKAVRAEINALQQELAEMSASE